MKDDSCSYGGRIQAVCACPTWAATGIGGEEARNFLERMAFPVSNGGAGVTSAINAILRSEEELSSVLLSDDGRDDDGGSGGEKNYIVANSRVKDYFIGSEFWMTSPFVTKTLGWRDTIVDICGLILLLGQRFTHEDFIIQESSPESFADEEAIDEFYEWSLNEVECWL